MKTATKCRSCDFDGYVTLSKHNRTKTPAATGVPCPKCGKHHLKRAKEKQ